MPPKNKGKRSNKKKKQQQPSAPQPTPSTANVGDVPSSPPPSPSTLTSCDKEKQVYSPSAPEHDKTDHHDDTTTTKEHVVSDADPVVMAASSSGAGGVAPPPTQSRVDDEANEGHLTIRMPTANVQAAISAVLAASKASMGAVEPSKHDRPPPVKPAEHVKAAIDAAVASVAQQRSLPPLPGPTAHKEALEEAAEAPAPKGPLSTEPPMPAVLDVAPAVAPAAAAADDDDSIPPVPPPKPIGYMSPQAPPLPPPVPAKGHVNLSSPESEQAKHGIMDAIQSPLAEPSLPAPVHLGQTPTRVSIYSNKSSNIIPSSSSPSPADDVKSSPSSRKQQQHNGRDDTKSQQLCLIL